MKANSNKNSNCNKKYEGEKSDKMESNGGGRLSLNRMVFEDLWEGDI